jgi:NADPH2:quinone reductase
VVGVRAVQVTRFGDPSVLVPTEVSDPVAGPGQVVVRVSYAATLHLDTRLRAGWGSEFFGVRPPYIPGNGVAGTVLGVGEGVAQSWLGRRVTAVTEDWGGYAERAVAAVSQLVRVPDTVDLRDAAALLHDGRTAFALLDSTGVHGGESVLITGAAGGMGILLVQLARAAGASVIGAARGEAKLDLVRKHGAEVTVDYSEPDWAAKVVAATEGRGPDVVFDGVGGSTGRQAFEIIRRGGRLSAHGAAGGEFTAIDPDEARRRDVTVRGIEQAQLDDTDGPRLTARALSEAEAGRLTPVIGQVFPLGEAADAHAAIEARTALGKTILAV